MDGIGYQYGGVSLPFMLSVGWLAVVTMLWRRDLRMLFRSLYSSVDTTVGEGCFDKPTPTTPHAGPTPAQGIGDGYADVLGRVSVTAAEASNSYPRAWCGSDVAFRLALAFRRAGGGC